MNENKPLEENRAEAAMDAWWNSPMSSEARAEGWDIFDCEGSSNGRWQIQHIDVASVAEGHAQLDDDDEAWRVVFAGTQPRHVRARELIREHCPQEWRDWCFVAHKLVDVSTLPDELRAAIVTARLLA